MIGIQVDSSKTEEDKSAGCKRCAAPGRSIARLPQVATIGDTAACVCAWLEADGIAPGQSVSHAGRVVELDERISLSSLSASSKRSTSPIRQNTLLKNACSPILEKQSTTSTVPLQSSIQGSSVVAHTEHISEPMRVATRQSGQRVHTDEHAGDCCYGLRNPNTSDMRFMRDTYAGAL
jgi:hypothetical protein